jgi:hypothetical protein
MRAAGRVEHIVGFDADPEAMRHAREMASSVRQRHRLRMPWPPPTCLASRSGRRDGGLLREIVPALNNRVVTDVSGTRPGVIAAARAAR